MTSPTGIAAEKAGYLIESSALKRGLGQIGRHQIPGQAMQQSSVKCMRGRIIRLSEEDPTVKEMQSGVVRLCCKSTLRPSARLGKSLIRCGTTHETGADKLPEIHCKPPVQWRAIRVGYPGDDLPGRFDPLDASLQAPVQEPIGE
jgi:hypothetical protein